MIDDEFVLRISHAIGVTEAKKRIARGIDEVKIGYLYLHNVETEWSGDRLNFRVSALGHIVQGSIDVADRYVELRAQMPMVIRFLVTRFRPIVEGEGRRLLR